MKGVDGSALDENMPDIKTNMDPRNISVSAKEKTADRQPCFPLDTARYRSHPNVSIEVEASAASMKAPFTL